MVLPLLVGAAVIVGEVAAAGAIGYVSYQHFGFFGYKPQARYYAH